MGSDAYTQPEASPQLGLIPRFITDFFLKMQEKKRNADDTARREGFRSADGPTLNESPHPVLLDYHMRASFLEVYGEDVYDLLDSERRSLPLREDSAGGVVVAGLTDKPISSPAEALDVLHEGTNNRTTAATLMNLTSSRSHAVFTVHLTQKTSGEGLIDEVATSKFTFVDLAGSERMKKTGAEGERAREGIKINEGLLALGNVINALADENRLANEKAIHVPYRQSKLTRLLQDALGGNSQTFFLACVSPSDTNVSETLSTLRYANRARNIRNAPTKNLDATTSELQRLNTLNRVLQNELIKARFRDENDGGGLDAIGAAQESLMNRADVVEYFDRIHRAVVELSGVNNASSCAFKPITATVHHSTSSIAVPTSFPKFDAPLPRIEATPHKLCSERIDDSFLIDVNPDEDLAILDRLLELQQHDHEFDRTTKQDDENLRKMDGDLRKEGALLLQLRENLKVYHSLKQKYEGLMAEVQQLEVEKDGLANQLETAKADPSTGNSATIKRQLEKVERSLTRARRETLTHRQKYKAAEDDARRCQVLERKISTLKQSKAILLKKQKEAAARYKEVTEAKTKELLALKRKEKVANARISKMKTEMQQHKSNLERRKQYSAKLSEKLKQTETHLVKILSTRQRDFVEPTSIVGKKGRPTSNHSCLAEGDDKPSLGHETQLLCSEDLESIKFISDKMISEKIEQAVSMSQYRQLVAEYTEIMRSVVSNVNILHESEANMALEDVGGQEQSIDDIREVIAEQELKLELLGVEVKEMESLLPDESKQAEDEEVVKKLMLKLPVVALSKMLLHAFSRVVELEVSANAHREVRDHLPHLGFTSSRRPTNMRMMRCCREKMPRYRVLRRS
jgi:Kinesin motor domain